MSVETEFDLGSLTWVKGELDNALEAARAALADWNGEDSNPLKAAAAHLHQVYGAGYTQRRVGRDCPARDRRLEKLSR